MSKRNRDKAAKPGKSNGTAPKPTETLETAKAQAWALQCRLDELRRDRRYPRPPEVVAEISELEPKLRAAAARVAELHFEAGAAERRAEAAAEQKQFWARQEAFNRSPILDHTTGFRSRPRSEAELRREYPESSPSVFPDGGFGVGTFNR